MSTQELERRIAEFAAAQPWNHNFTLPGGVQTRPAAQTSHGKNLVKWRRIKPLLDVIGVSGKRVLDVGCNEGFFSLELRDMGAEVLGIDIDRHRIDKARFILEATGKRGVEFEVMDIYSENFSKKPRFDLCLCMGFLHRIPDPFTAMARLGDKTNFILFEWKALKFGPHDDAFAYFSPKGTDKQDYYGTEYWLLSYSAVEAILKRLGFTRFHRVDDPTQRRAILVAGKVDNPIFHQPDTIIHRGRARAVASHTKRYLRTLMGVISGKVNA